MKLSIAMIVKNEEKNIERTLIPLKELGKYIESEIIIVDTGSIDNTINIAGKYTNKIYVHKWTNDFAEMRNLSINYCNGDWIMIVDADEVLYDIEKLADLLNSNYINDYNGVFVKITDYNKNMDKTLKEGYKSPILRIMKKKCAYYTGKVHEQPKFEKPLLNSDVRFIHYGYDNFDAELMEQKFNRNLTLLLDELKDDEKNIYTNFQISTTYLMHSDIKQAYEYIKIAYEEAKDNMKEHIYVIDKYCLILYKLRLYNELIKKSLEGIELRNDFMDFYYYLGEAYNNKNENNKSIEAYKTYLNLLNDADEFFDAGLCIKTKGFKDIALYNMSVDYYQIDNYYKALECLETIENKKVINGKMAILLKTIFEGKIYERINLLNDYIDKDNYEIVLTYLNNELSLELLSELMDNRNIVGTIKEMMEIIQKFKKDNMLTDILKTKIKAIIEKNKRIYTIYAYYLIREDINEINYLLKYGKDRLELVVNKLCVLYFDINEVFIKNVNLIDKLESRMFIEKSIINARKIEKIKRRDIFLKYISDGYCYMNLLYKKEVLIVKEYLLSDEERCILNIKEALSYKFTNQLMYIQKMKKTLDISGNYSDYIELLIDDIEIDKGNLNESILKLIPQLKQNISSLVENHNYQEAYNLINQTIDIINFDLELMMLKYRILVEFEHFEDAKECFKEIVLYGDCESVREIINEVYNE